MRKKAADLEWNLYASILIETFILLAIVFVGYAAPRFWFFVLVLSHLLSVHSCTTFNTFNLSSFFSAFFQLSARNPNFFLLEFFSLYYFSLHFYSHRTLHAVIQLGIFSCCLFPLFGAFHRKVAVSRSPIEEGEAPLQGWRIKEHGKFFYLIWRKSSFIEPGPVLEWTNEKQSGCVCKYECMVLKSMGEKYLLKGQLKSISQGFVGSMAHSYERSISFETNDQTKANGWKPAMSWTIERASIIHLNISMIAWAWALNIPKETRYRWKGWKRRRQRMKV